MRFELLIRGGAASRHGTPSPFALLDVYATVAEAMPAAGGAARAYALPTKKSTVRHYWSFIVLRAARRARFIYIAALDECASLRQRFQVHAVNL